MLFKKVNLYVCGIKGVANALVFQNLYISLHPRLINECLTYLLIKNESIRNRFHFNSRFV